MDGVPVAWAVLLVISGRGQGHILDLAAVVASACHGVLSSCVLASSSSSGWARILHLHIMVFGYLVFGHTFQLVVAIRAN